MRFKILCLIPLFSFMLMQASAQRYSHQVFDEVSLETATYSTQKGLEMDIYQSVEDSTADRPLVLFVHGGGFAGGARNEPEIQDFCRNMARRGMVAVSMSYTLVMKGQSFGCDQSANNKIATFSSVATEIQLATQYLIRRKQELNFVTDKIILIGSSAGAEAVLHAAFWQDGTHLPQDFSYAGLVSMAGAIANLDWINEETAIPMQFFHGTCDNLVPYATAPHHYCQPTDAGYLPLYGPATIVEKLKTLNQGYYLITGCNDGHSWAGRPFKKYQQEIADFVLHDVILGKTRQIHQIIPSQRPCKLEQAPSCQE